MTDNNRVHLLLLNCGVALVYFLAGKLGQILAIPPGTITVLWPPSGIALAAILLRGHSVLPGIFLGAYLVNLAAPISMPALVSGLGIAVGSALQPVLIASFLGRAKIADNPFADASTVVRFAVLVIPGTIVSASVGVVSLRMTGLLNEQLLFTWSTWWLGDALGVLAFTPALFLPLRERLSGARRSLMHLTLIMSAIAFLTMLASIFLAYRAYVDAEREHLLDAAQIQSSLLASIADFDEQLSDENAAGGATQAALSQIERAFRQTQSIGSQREILIAAERDGVIHWLQSRRTPLGELPAGIAIGTGIAQPMSLALQGLTGTLTGADFNGRQVLAAHFFIDSLGLGLVVSTLYSELREPFIVAAALVLLITFFLVLAGIIAFRKVSQPIMGVLERRSRELQQLVKEQTEHLEKSEAEFRQLIESAPDAMVIVDRSGVIQLCNQQCENLTGFSRQELVGAAIEALVPVARRTHHKGFRNQYMDDPQARQLDRGKGLFCLKKDGSEFPVDIALSPIGSTNDSLIAASFRDVTERNAYEAMLKKNETRLQEAFRAGNMEAWEMDVATGRLESSLYLYERFGYDSHSVDEGEDPWLQAIHPEDRPTVTAALEAVREGRESSYHVVYRVYDVQKRTRWIESTAKPTATDESGRPGTVVGIRLDITERVAAETLLNEKLKELEEFNTLAVGRELRMIELKKEINRLHSQLGKDERYEIVT